MEAAHDDLSDQARDVGKEEHHRQKAVQMGLDCPSEGEQSS